MLLTMANDANMRTVKNTMSLKLTSFNMHGFQQDCPVIEDLIADCKPFIFLLQEHWLTPASLGLFNSRFNEYTLWWLRHVRKCREGHLSLIHISEPTRPY